MVQNMWFHPLLNHGFRQFLGVFHVSSGLDYWIHHGFICHDIFPLNISVIYIYTYVYTRMISRLNGESSHYPTKYRHV